jgi:hypothetical protein
MTFSQLLAAIVATLIVGATIITGLTAVENGVNSMILSRKETVLQYCLAHVESQKPTSALQRTLFNQTCVETENNRIDANFAKTISYIACFKLIVPSASGSSSTAESIISSAGATCNL